MEQLIATPSLGFSEAVNKAASNILKFEGRSRRSEYWWTMAIVYLVSIVLTPLAGFVLSLLTIPLTFRRLHDTGRSGWWWGGSAILQGIVIVLFIYDMVMAYLNASNMYGYGDEIMWAFLLKYSVLSVLIVIYKIVLIYCTASIASHTKMITGCRQNTSFKKKMDRPCTSETISFTAIIKDLDKEDSSFDISLLVVTTMVLMNAR